MADIRSSQNIAQVEWQIPGILKVFQTIAQVEYSSTLNEKEKLVNITSTVSETDSIGVYETGLLVDVTSTVSETDFQDYVDTGLAVALSMGVSSTDTWPIDESYIIVDVTSLVEETDLLDAIEDRIVNLSMTLTETNAQDFVDNELSVSAGITISAFDSVPIGESYLQVDIVSTVSETDLLAAIGNVEVPLTMTVLGTDVMVFEPENRSVSMSMAITEADVLQCLENVEILMNMTISEIDGFSAVSRRLYELTSRVKSFELIRRIKTYYLTKE